MFKPFSRIVDLTHEMYTGMPNIGGVPITFWPVETHEGTLLYTDGKIEMESRMMLMAEHCGTHLDAPRHCDKRGTDLAQLPLEQLVVPGHFFDFTHKRDLEPITIADFEAAIESSGQQIQPQTAVVCWTGRDKVWGQGEWIKKRPFVPTDTASWLIDQGMTLFATDLIGMDDPADWTWQTHAVWLKAGVCMVQQLRNLDQLAGQQFLFCAAPLKIRDGTGCPVRAFALVQ
jgi:arylformamidase